MKKFLNNKSWFIDKFFRSNTGPKPKPFLFSSKTSQYYQKKFILDILEQNSPNRTIAAAKKKIKRYSCDDENLDTLNYHNSSINLSISDSEDILNQNNLSRTNYNILKESLSEKNILF